MFILKTSVACVNSDAPFLEESEAFRRLRFLYCSRSQQVREVRVSTPPQGRGLALPVVWGNTRAESVSVPVRSQSPSDEELMVRLSNSDSNVLRLLFQRYSRLVLGIAIRILRDHGEAEEVVQETFFLVFQKARLFEPLKGTVKAWIVQIAYHQALDRKAYLDRRGFNRATEIGSLEDSLVGAADLEREIGSRLNRIQMERAFEGLSEMQRRTLELCYFEGLELREIGIKLNESLGNIRHHHYRGLERLRRSAFVERLREK
jgi:RNA polymerase sigma-70 factor, ECF subfamily